MTREELKTRVLQALQGNRSRALGPLELAVDIGFSAKGNGPAAVAELAQELVADGMATCRMERQADGGELVVYEAV